MSIPGTVVRTRYHQRGCSFFILLEISWTIIFDSLWTGNSADYWAKDSGINSIGPFSTKTEAEAAMKYIKSKFVRAMLSILKNTQGNTRPVWKYVPLQDFSDKSDINWNTSISNIDKQLYKKYGLTDEEIAFIETNVKEME